VTGAWWVEQARDVVAIGGDDAESYLQGQISQDVSALAPGDSTWSLVLSPQGKVEAWFRLHAMADGTYVADLDAGFSPQLIARLERFRLRVDVRFEPLSWRFGVLRGESVEPPAAPEGGLVVAVDWPGFEGYDVLGPTVQLPGGVEVVDALHYERARVGAGWPVMGAEFTEKTIPAEAGIVERSVSFTKGCFTGQELVARIDSRGNNTPRRLCRLVGVHDQLVEVGDTVTFDGKDVGVVSSAVAGDGARPAVALAYLHRSVALPAEVVVPSGTMAVVAP